MRVKANPAILIIFLFLLNFIVGILFINEGLFHHDSVKLAEAVEETYKTGVLQPANAGRYGSVIINLIISLPFLMSGHNADFPIRLSGILFHSLSIMVLFLFIKEIFKDEICAFFSAALLSFTPFYLSPNTYGKEHGASMFFLILSFFLLSLSKKKNSQILILLSSLIFAFSIAIRESILITVPLLFLFYFDPEISMRPFKIVLRRERLKVKSLLLFILPLVLGFGLIFFIYFKNVIYNTLFTDSSGSNKFLGFFYVFRLALQDLLLSFPDLIFAFFVMGILEMVKDSNLFFGVFFFIWFMTILYFGNLSSYVARYLDIVVVPVYVFVAYYLSRLYSKDRILAIVMIFYLIFNMFLYIHPILKFRHGYNGMKQFSLFVKEKTEENAVIIAMDEGPFIEYYGKRRVISHPVGDPVKIRVFTGEVKEYLDNKVPVYLIESGFSYDPEEFFKNQLFENFDVDIVGQKLAEDYHKSEIRFHFYYEKLFKINLKQAA